MGFSPTDMPLKKATSIKSSHIKGALAVLTGDVSIYKFAKILAQESDKAVINTGSAYVMLFRALKKAYDDGNITLKS